MILFVLLHLLSPDLSWAKRRDIAKDAAYIAWTPFEISQTPQFIKTLMARRNGRAEQYCSAAGFDHAVLTSIQTQLMSGGAGSVPRNGKLTPFEMPSPQKRKYWVFDRKKGGFVPVPEKQYLAAKQNGQKVKSEALPRPAVGRKFSLLECETIEDETAAKDQGTEPCPDLGSVNAAAAKTAEDMLRLMTQVGDKMESHIQEVTAENHKAAVQSSGYSVMVIYKKTCSNWKNDQPAFEALAEQYAGKVKCFKIAGEDHPDVKAEYNYDGSPYYVVFKDGKPTHYFSGAELMPQIEALVRPKN